MGWVVRFSLDERSVELASSLLWDAGTTGIAEDGDRLVAGFDDRAGADGAAVLLAGLAAVVESVEPARWEGTGEVTALALRLADGSERKLAITAGPTFGHGGHPTTALALDLLTATVGPGDRVLDVGTGSGILAIAAAALGAGPVVGIDIDPAATDIARANAATNGVEILAGLQPVGAAADLVGGRRFDVVVANVLLPAHRQLAGAVGGVLAPGGRLVTTGYLDADGPLVESLHLGALRRAGGHPATVEERRSVDGWAACRFRAGRAG
jgi:ribosomal protein L11 methyltransferase